jgi:hypothetical protein
MSKPSLLDEVREVTATQAKDRDADGDWDKIEASLLAKVEREPPQRAPSRRAQAVTYGAALLLAASVFGLFVSKATPPQAMQAPPTARQLPAGAVAGREASAVVTASGQPAEDGQNIGAGETVEVQGAKVFFERAGKVSFAFEAGTRAQLQASTGPLFVRLERGALEADVVKVAAGEAFGVDIASTSTASSRPVARVAVHGTHLRVERAGDHVVVDLTEGVVAVGRAPRSGMTVGRLVTAPAHVEFDVADPEGSLRVDHELAHVRAAAAVKPPSPAVASQSLPDDEHPEQSPTTPAARLNPAVPSASQVAVAPAGSSPLPPKEHIITAVQACIASRVQPGRVKVFVSSKLTLRIAAGGRVEIARFEPPLDPEVQTCAAATIYETHFPEQAEPSTLSFPIEAAR